jgi:hypothetical protein
MFARTSVSCCEGCCDGNAGGARNVISAPNPALGPSLGDPAEERGA